jgi:glucosamine 6-phosphate synthetase-like amidotransferase/phosphosugar isomerase protein
VRLVSIPYFLFDLMRLFFFHFTSRFTVCGILGLLLHDTTINAASEICEGLSLLQHRGQDACGIITCGPRGRLYQCKANGMVRDVFTQDAILRLIGGMGIGHGEPFFPVGTSSGQRISFCLVAPALVYPIKYRRSRSLTVMTRTLQSDIQLQAARTMQRLSHSTSTPHMA